MPIEKREIKIMEALVEPSLVPASICVPRLYQSCLWIYVQPGLPSIRKPDAQNGQRFLTVTIVVVGVVPVQHCTFRGSRIVRDPTARLQKLLRGHRQKATAPIALPPY